MTQPDIAVQPNESAEVAALRVLARIAGWCVTHTTDGGHATGSLHTVAATRGVGRAVDLADRAGPEVDSDALLAINHDAMRLLPISMISELIYSGPDAILVKNGRIVDPAFYGSVTMAGHHNHVHLGVIPGFTYSGGSMPDDPNLPNITGPVTLHLCVDSTGNCTGYYIFSEKTAELHSFGDGAKIHYYGRSEVLGA